MLRRILRHLRSEWRERWLRHVTNLVHVGANTGQEASLYARYGLGVLWIEPIPSVFQALIKNIAPYPRQRAHQALVADVAAPHVLHVTNNEGASSSIFDLAEHREIWPTVKFEADIELMAETLDDILSNETRPYDALVMDTQGSELLVLKGAGAYLDGFRYIKTEAANFNAYAGGTTDREIAQFLAARGFDLIRRDCFARKPDGGGAYFDLLFVRRSA